jgi:hypothetical protein
VGFADTAQTISHRMGGSAMLRHLRTLLAAFAVVGMLAVPATSAFAATNVELVENQKAPPMVDLLVMRPLGLVMLGVSATLWVPVQSFTMIIRPRDWMTPIDYMLKRPSKFVFVDPLGEH